MELSQEHISKIIELVDSGVKIGLGALIGAVVTYLNTRANHKHEISKVKIGIKIKILEDATEKIDHYFLSTEKLLDEWLNIINKYQSLEALEKDTKMYESYSDIHKKFADGMTSANIAISKFNLLGFSQVNEALVKHNSKIADENEKIVTTRFFMDKKALNELEEHHRKMKKICNNEIRKYFEKMT